MRGDVLKNHLELLVLTALRTGPGHGYSIIRAIRERSRGEFELLEGSLYPALHRLERAGLVGSSWSEVGGRKRRVYKLSRRGRVALQEQERDWRRFERAMNLVLASDG
jgi:PadR family transcriptional regulator, regulatory protein PadR